MLLGHIQLFETKCLPRSLRYRQKKIVWPSVGITAREISYQGECADLKIGHYQAQKR